MKISVEGAFGKQVFEMTDAVAMQLLCIANSMAHGGSGKEEKESEVETVTVTSPFQSPLIPKEACEAKDAVAAFAASHPAIRAKQPPRNSRVSRMFGDRMPQQEQQEQREGYKGFMLIQCEHCGLVKGTNFKNPQSEYRCPKCGGTTELHDLKPAYMYCECGEKFKYMTNSKDSIIEHTCIGCGRTMKLVINKTRTAYVMLDGANKPASGGGFGSNVTGMKPYYMDF